MHTLDSSPERWFISMGCGMRLTLASFNLLPGWRSDSDSGIRLILWEMLHGKRSESDTAVTTFSYTNEMFGTWQKKHAISIYNLPHLLTREYLQYLQTTDQKTQLCQFVCRWRLCVVEKWRKKMTKRSQFRKMWTHCHKTLTANSSLNEIKWWSEFFCIVCHCCTITIS